jgi:hypothetical protein
VKIAAADGAVLPGYTPGRDVHRFVSPTGGQLDLSGGEGVLRPELTAAIGPQRWAAANRASKSGRIADGLRYLGGFESGGILGRVVSDGGRAVEELGAKVVGALLKKYGGDGPIGGKGFAAGLNYVKQHAGHPYQFATIWDCSGLMGSVEAIVKGKDPNRRYWSTPAFAGGPEHAQGFTRNKRSAFMIGVNPAPGKFGHTAGTINGVNIESSGGVGVHYGPSARGWNNPMFPLHYGLAGGGIWSKPKDGDLPFDTLDPRGKAYDPQIRRLFEAGRLGVGYAGGTSSATPGWHPVGENGREYVRFRGGEQVRTARQMPTERGGDTYIANGLDVKELAREWAKQRRQAEALQPTY